MSRLHEAPDPEGLAQGDDDARRPVFERGIVGSGGALSNQLGPFLTPGQLADRWVVPVAQLANWRHQGQGPAYVELEHYIRYRRDTVLSYENAHGRGAGVAS